MTHTIGSLVNLATGYVVDAGIIIIMPEEGVVTVLHGDGVMKQYTGAEFPEIAVLRYEFCPN